MASQASPFGSGFSSDGAVVRAVQSQSPAAAAGLVAGDVIDSVNGRTITSGSDLTSVMNATHSGDKVVVMWLDRSGARHRATVSLAEGAAA